MYRRTVSLKHRSPTENPFVNLFEKNRRSADIYKWWGNELSIEWHIDAWDPFTTQGRHIAGFNSKHCRALRATHTHTHRHTLQSQTDMQTHTRIPDSFAGPSGATATTRKSPWPFFAACLGLSELGALDVIFLPTCECMYCALNPTFVHMHTVLYLSAKYLHGRPRQHRPEKVNPLFENR